MYECEEQKQHSKEYPNELPLCCHCKMFMREGDACLEDSVLMPLHKMLHPDRKPCRFVDDGSEGKPKPIIYIQTNNGNSMQTENQKK